MIDREEVPLGHATIGQILDELDARYRGVILAYNEDGRGEIGKVNYAFPYVCWSGGVIQALGLAKYAEKHIMEYLP